MIKNLRSLLVVIIVCGLGVITFLSWRTIVPSGEKKEASQEQTVADLKLDQMRYTETREGIKEWELEAASAIYFKEENTVVCDRVKATFYGKNQKTYVLVSGKGKFYPQTKTIEVFGGVTIDSSDGYQLRTQSLKYEAEKKELFTTDRVKMAGPQLSVEGVGLIVDIDHSRLKVLHQVETILFQVPEKGFFEKDS